MSLDQIEGSPDLQRRYAGEYASMLRVAMDRGVAREAARLNVSALRLGQPRIVPLEGRFKTDTLRNALTRGGGDLGTIRRAVSRLVAREAPEILRTLARGRESGPER